jgi:hypothetical protein
MLIQSDEESLTRMLGVEPAFFPASVVAEYNLRIRMYHMDGHSGALGTVGIIDLVRSMGLGPTLPEERPPTLNWEKLPRDGTVHVEARVEYEEDGDTKYKWLPGTYRGIVAMGTLAIRLDGRLQIDEFGRKDVRIVRENPVEPVVRSVDETFEIDEVVLVEDGDEVKQGIVKGYKDGRVMVLCEGKERSRGYSPECVTRLTEREVSPC